MDRRAEDRNARAASKFATPDWPTSAVGRYSQTTTMENPYRNSLGFFSSDFIAVALFSGIGLAVSLIAIACGEQGSWL